MYAFVATIVKLKFGSPIALALDMNELERSMEPKRIESNTAAVKDLTMKNKDMTLDVTLTKYVVKKKKQKFDTARCARVIDGVEDATLGDPSRPALRVSRSNSLHTLALRILCKFLGIEEASVLLACHAHSIRAVHAVALTLLGILRDHEAGDKSRLTPLLKAHKGPMTLFYDTTEGSKWIGLVGVKHLPSQRLAAHPGIPESHGNQFEYDMLCLNDKYQDHLKNIMFISDEEAAAMGAGAGPVRDDDDDEGDDCDGAGENSADANVQDDGIGAPLGNMDGDFD